MEPKDRIIFALDVNELDEALALVDMLHPYVGYFKIGLQLLTSQGAPKVVKAIQGRGGRIFYDGKFLDIPNTVAAASVAVSNLGVGMFNIHASGGIEMMRAAVQNQGRSKVLAVTVLTSLAEDDAHLIYGAPSKAKVIEFANWAVLAEVDGLICSPQELKVLWEREELRDELFFVTPGVRPVWAAKGDQKRTTTPLEAIRGGADYLVMGRPIRKPPEHIGGPVEAAKRIAEEIAEGEKGGDSCR